jgi:hypothetical protein
VYVILEGRPRKNYSAGCLLTLRKILVISIPIPYIQIPQSLRLIPDLVTSSR